MKRKIIIFAILGIALIGLGLYFLLSEEKSTYKAGEKDFAVTDTSGIDKIFLADKTGLITTLTLEENNRWMVNGKFVARADMMENLFDVIKRITVRSPVAQSATENILKRMATNNIKVEIYKKGKIEKIYYVGGPTADSFGSFLLMDGAEHPYICYLPGHNGYITSFYNPNPNEWRDRIIFALHPKEIKSIKVDYTYDPSAGYTVEQFETSKFRVKDYAGNEVPNIDTAIVKAYFIEFKKIAYENFVDIPEIQMDSVAKKYNLFTLTVTDINDKSVTVKGHRIKLLENSENEFGKPVEYDDNRMYGEISTFGKEYVFIQYLTFDRILKTTSFFRKK